MAELVSLTSSHRVVAFLDDHLAPGTDVMGLPVWGDSTTLADLPRRGITAVHVAIGHNPTRVTLLARARAAGLKAATLVHPRACVAPSATLAWAARSWPWRWWAPRPGSERA